MPKNEIQAVCFQNASEKKRDKAQHALEEAQHHLEEASCRVKAAQTWLDEQEAKLQKAKLDRANASASSLSASNVQVLMSAGPAWESAEYREYS